MVIAWSNIEREDPSKSRGKTQNIGDTEWRWLNELLPGKKARSTCRRDIFFCCDTRERLKLYTPVIIGSYIYFKTTHTGWQLARVVGIAEDGESKSLPHTIKMFDLGKQYNVRLSQEALTTVSEEPGAWCWHVHRRTRSVKNYTPSLE